MFVWSQLCREVRRESEGGTNQWPYHRCCMCGAVWHMCLQKTVWAPSPKTVTKTNRVVVYFCVGLCASPGLWKTKVGAHPYTGEAVHHLLDCGCIWEVEHERHCREAQRKVQNVLVHIEYLNDFYINTWATNGFRLTSVGHEDFHCGILQQVSSGKDGPNLCEQPFPMESFRVGEYLEDEKKSMVNFRGWGGIIHKKERKYREVGLRRTEEMRGEDRKEGETKGLVRSFFTRWCYDSLSSRINVLYWSALMKKRFF